MDFWRRTTHYNQHERCCFHKEYPFYILSKVDEFTMGLYPLQTSSLRVYFADHPMTAPSPLFPFGSADASMSAVVASALI
jgi:hypothetical protein